MNCPNCNHEIDLHQHDAEVRKPLVEALTELYIGRTGELELPEWANGLIDAVLAQCK